MNDNKNHILDLSEHPKEWSRRISKLENALHKDPALINLKRAYNKFHNMPAIVSDERDICKNTLYDAWHKANEAYEKKIDKRKDTTRWYFSISLSAIAIILSIVSAFTNAYFQRENLKINKQRFELSRNLIPKGN